MGKAIIDESLLIGIADAIRTKKGTNSKIPTTSMSSEILSISGGGSVEEGHRVVNSIIADGASYIKTGIHPAPNYTIEMECRVHTIVDDHYDFLFGTRYSSAGRWHARFNKTSDNGGILRLQRSSYYYDNVTGEWLDTACTRDDCSEYKVFKLAKAYLYIDSELIGTFDTANIHTDGHYPFQLYLFANNDTDGIGGDALTSSGYIECRYVKIWDANDELILDLIPVVKADGTVCMFDLVNERYYYNAGTGTFTYSE